MQRIEVEDILQVIYNRFRERGGEWPDFYSIQRWISRFRGMDVADMLDSILDSLMKPVSQVEGSPDPSGKLFSRLRSPEGREGLRTPITKDEPATELRSPLFTDSESIARLLALLRAERPDIK